VRILLVSTYELGHQPLHLASPAASLRDKGHEVRMVDLSLGADTLDAGDADGVAYSVPMHTALRLAIASAHRVREVWPSLPIAFYGLYAGMGGEDLAVAQLVGEYETALVEWAGALTPRAGTDIGQRRFLVPDRSGLQPLTSYARLAGRGQERVAGYVEASHGCRHRCRHCPIPAVYDGRYRITGLETVTADVGQLVAMGAEHITFGDPDFLNAPRYSLDVLRAVHKSHPTLSFDVTVKVSHILDHQGLWPELAGLGVVMVVSAFETTNNRILAILDKGHTARQMAEAVAVVRSAGIEIRPSWMPFTPWTEPGDLSDILEFLARHELLDAIDPVQLSIRLLVPKGSLLADRPEMGEYDSELLTYRWLSPRPEEDKLQAKVAQLAEAGAGVHPLDTLRSIWELVIDRPFPRPSDRDPLRLTEPWFCCAEPTSRQLANL